MCLAAQLGPQAAARLVEAEKGGGEVGRRLLDRVGRNIGHAAILLQQAGFVVGQQGGEAVQSQPVLMRHMGCTDRCQYIGLLGIKVADVSLHIGSADVQVLTRLGLGRGQSGDIAFVRGDRFTDQLHDEGAAGFLGIGVQRHAGQQGQHGQRSGADFFLDAHCGFLLLVAIQTDF